MARIELEIYTPGYKPCLLYTSMPPLGEGRIRALTDGIGHAVSDAHVAKMREMLARRWEHLLAGSTVVESRSDGLSREG